MPRLEERAPAKINLSLHVTGQRADGYHLIDTLVTFTEAGDLLFFERSDTDGFSLSGRFADALSGSDPGDNLVIRARDGLRALLAEDGHSLPPVHIHLQKNLPVASGIGGGSADAAACLRGLMRLAKARPDAEKLQRLALSLGADVPMCLHSRPLIARGIGEEIQPVALPPFGLLLVNPLKPVSTPAIFRLLTEKRNPPMPEAASGWGASPLSRLASLRNDLQPAAETLEPAILTVIEALKKTGAVLARMSGSGATCFGIYGDDHSLFAATDILRHHHPDWFIEPTVTLS